jgi:LCP family protein required for cell wall assembly
MRKFLNVMLYIAVGAVIVGGLFGVLDAIMSPTAADNGHGSAGQPNGLTSWFSNPVANVDRMNILLVGADARTLPTGQHDVGRADSIMLLCVSPKNKRIAIFSLPRDFLITLAQVPKGVRPYPQKINAAWAFGGAPLIRSSVEKTLGIKIDYYVEADLKTFPPVVDKLGGVDIDVPDIEGQGRGMNYDDNWGNLHVHLKPGPQHLNGLQAEGFCRFRHSSARDAKGHPMYVTDTQRAGNQQIFIKAMMEQKMKLSNFPALMSASGYAIRHLNTDMEWRTAVGLLQVMRGADMHHVLQLTVPTDDKIIGGGWYCTAKPGAIAQQNAEINAYLSGVTPLPADTASTAPANAVKAGAAAPAAGGTLSHVRILNGSGVPGAAKRASDLLQGGAYHVDATANAPSYEHPVTLIQYKPGADAAAQAAATQLGVASAQLQPMKAGGVGPDLVVTLGNDFAPRVGPAPGPRHKAKKKAVH